MTDVTVIIPCFNREGLIGRAIDSVLSQEIAAELIVVDDGSTDRSWDVIQGYGDRVTAIRIANSGPSRARNVAVERATARFIRFLDSDDRMPEASLARHLAAARALGGRQIAVGDAVSIDDRDQRIAAFGYGYSGLVPPGPIPRAIVISQVMNAWLPMFPTAALREVGGFDPSLSLSEDHDLSLRLVRAGYSFVRVPIEVCEVREHCGPRLSRNLGSSGYRRLESVYRAIWDQLQTGAEDPLRPDERRAFGRMIWTLGRDAVREGLAAEGASLFELARGMAGRDAEAGRLPARILYRLLSPVAAERILLGAKQLGRRR